MKNDRTISSKLIKAADPRAERELFQWPSEWPVYNTYEICWAVTIRSDSGNETTRYVAIEGDSETAEAPKVPNSAGEPEIVVRALVKNGVRRMYDPLNAIGAFITFARLLDEPHVWDGLDVTSLIEAISDEDLLEWIHEYGLPGAWSVGDIPRPTDLGGEHFARDKLLAIHQEIATARQILSLCEDCVTRDFEALSRRISVLPVSKPTSETYFEGSDYVYFASIDGRPIPVPIVPVIDSTPLRWGTEDTWPAYIYGTFACEFLVHECDRRRSHMRPVVSMTHYNPLAHPDLPFAVEVETAWYGGTLLSAMYLQLWWLITENTTMRQCRHCSSMFFVTKGDQHYCPHPLGGGRQSLCSKKDYYHRRQKGRRLYSERCTAEEIAEYLGPETTSLRTVQGWVDRWDSEKGCG